MKSRSVSLLALCGLLAVGVSGCSGCQEPPSSPEASAKENGASSDGRQSPKQSSADSSAPAETATTTAAPSSDHPSAIEPEPFSSDESSAEKSISLPAKSSGPTTPTSASQPAPTGSASPAVALRAARQALSRANELADQGRSADAFKAALAGWEAARRYPNNPELRRISAQLLRRLEQDGEAANRKASPVTDKASVLE